MKNIVIWDLETSGFGSKARILEIGAITVFNGTVIEHNWLLNHNMDIPEDAAKIHGLTKEVLAEKGMDPSVALKEFTDILIQCDEHITHNGFMFDIPYLVREIAKVFDRDEDYSTILRLWLDATAYDTAVKIKGDKLGRSKGDKPYVRFAKDLMKTPAKGIHFNLKLACEELGIDTEGVEMHRALGDTKLTYEVYKAQQQDVV